MKRILCKTGLFLLRKHWVRPTIKRDSVVYRDSQGAAMQADYLTTKVTVTRDFEDLYFFPTLAAKLVATPQLKVDVKLTDGPEIFGGNFDGKRGEKMYFERLPETK